MAEYNVASTTNPTKIPDYSVNPQQPDSSLDQKETYYYNTNFTKYFGIYKQTAKIKSAINAYATWVLNNGYETDARTEVILENITGWGEDSFNSFLWNMLVIKKLNGDAYAHIIRDDNGTMINLKPINPTYMRHVCNRKGRIIRYDYINPSKKGKPVSYQPSEILHLCNDRVADEIHGVSVIEAVQWNIEATEEIKRLMRKKFKNSGIIGMVEADTDDTNKINDLKPTIKEGVERGDFLLMPKGVMEAKPWEVKLHAQDTVLWLRYLDDDFYQSLNIPKVILGGNPEATEAGAKISYLAYEPIYTKEITELEADLWNQLALRITFNRPASMMDNVQSDEAKNTKQTGFQPNDVQAGVGQ